jgi:hypothetical protein
MRAASTHIIHETVKGAPLLPVIPPQAQDRKS